MATPVLVAPAIPPFERLRPRQTTTVRQQRREVIEEGDSFFWEVTMSGEARSRRGGGLGSQSNAAAARAGVRGGAGEAKNRTFYSASVTLVGFMLQWFISWPR